MVWQHGHSIKAQFDKTSVRTVTTTKGSGSLLVVYSRGEEARYGAVTDLKPSDPISLACRPPVSWSRKPEDWDISLLISKPAGIIPSFYYNITPPNSRTANIKVESLPHEGEKYICLQFKMGVPWAIGSGAPVSDQHFWNGWTNYISNENDVTDEEKIDEEKQVKTEAGQKQETVD